MSRTRAERRHNNVKKAIRKRKLAKEIYWTNPMNPDKWEWYDNLHQYSKNKIHCSCSVCRSKTKNKGKRNIPGNFLPSYNPPIRDRRKLEYMDYTD